MTGKAKWQNGCSSNRVTVYKTCSIGFLAVLWYMTPAWNTRETMSLDCSLFSNGLFKYAKHATIFQLTLDCLPAMSISWLQIQEVYPKSLKTSFKPGDVVVWIWPSSANN